MKAKVCIRCDGTGKVFGHPPPVNRDSTEIARPTGPAIFFPCHCQKSERKIDLVPVLA